VDRDAVERRDLTLGRRGYDPAAVDARLRQVTDAMERLRSRPPRMSSGTSEQVGAILEAAEASAAGHFARALNIALRDTRREETPRCPAEHFALADREALDDVYARAGE
jgi:hypothetical protein